MLGIVLMATLLGAAARAQEPTTTPQAGSEAPGNAKKALIPVASFVRDDQFSIPRLSPDGRFIAVRVRMPIDGQIVSTISVYSLPELKPVSSIRMQVYELPLTYHWVSPTRLVVAKGKEYGSREAPYSTGEILAFDFDGTKQEYLYGRNMFKFSRRGDRYGDDHGIGSVTAVPHERTGKVILNSQLWGTDRSMLYEIDSSSASRALLADIPVPSLSFLIQNDGTPRFAFGTDENINGVAFRRNDANEQWEQMKGTDFGKGFWPKAFSSDDSEFIATSSPTGGPEILVRENTKTGARRTVLADLHGSITGLMRGSRRGLPIAARTDIGKPQWQYLDDNDPDTTLHKMLSGYFTGSLVSFVNFTDDGMKLLFWVQSDRDPGTYYLFDKLTKKATPLFTSMREIDPDQMAERRPLSFDARDGTTLFGYLTVPRNPGKNKLPLVVLPHGGPHGPFDTWFFNPDAQFLASRGYAVLQINYRGSGGRGWNFQRSGYRQWGNKIQDDLIDGTKWAIAQGEIDPNRICTYGASFGAYSAMMLVAREPTMFKCAIGYAGAYDLNLMYESDRVRTDKKAFNAYQQYLGQDKHELDRYSPSKLAAKITVPVMLVHGEKDERTPPLHAEAMRAALVKENRPPEWLMVPNEGHGFYNVQNRITFYERLEAFLAKHIGSPAPMHNAAN